MFLYSGAAVLLVLAAVGGVTLLALRLGRKVPPLPLALLHGVLASTGLASLLVAVVRDGAGGLPLLALGLFVLASLFGISLIRMHLHGRELPLAIILTHAAVAGAALAMLLLYLAGQ